MVQKHSTDSMLSFDSNSSFGFCLYLVNTLVITLVITPTYLVIIPSITLAAAASSRIQCRLPDLNRMIFDFQTFAQSSYFGMTSCAGSPSFSLASSLAIMSALPAPQAAKTQQLAALTAGRVRVTLAGGGFGESVIWATIRPPSSRLGS